MADSDEETEISPESSIEWERIHWPRLHDQSQPDPSNVWSMVAIREYIREDRSIIFPPINHEGLHTSTSTSTSSTHSDHEDREFDRSSSSSLYDLHRESPPSQPPPPIPRPRQAVDVAAWLNLGVGLLHSKVTAIASSLRNVATTGGTHWPFHSPAGAVAAAMLLAFLYLKLRWRRRLRMRVESRDHLILLIKEKDERINQLLHQIAQLNEVLLSLHRVTLSKTG